MNRKNIITLFAVLISFACARADSFSVTDDEYLGRDALLIENSLVTARVIPELGGRVISFRLGGDPDKETLYTARHNLRFDPGEQWLGADYGGICDVGGGGWPGPFWGLKYNVKQEPEQYAVTLSAGADGIEAERTLELIPDSTAIRISVIHTNRTENTLPYSVRTHSELAVGTAADNDDHFFHRDGKGLRHARYRLGWEIPRFTYENPEEGWMAFVDSRQRLALVRLFENADKDIKVLLWRGHNEGGPVRDEKGGFYAADRIFDNVSLAPGETVNAAETFYIIDGLRRVDFVKKFTAGSLTFDRPVYAAGLEGQFAVTIGSAFVAGPYRITMNYANETTEKTLRAFKAGSAESVTFDIQITASTDVEVTVKDILGNIVAQFSRQIKIDNEGYSVARENISAAKQIRQRIIETLTAAQTRDTDRGRAIISLVNTHINSMQQALGIGDIYSINENAETVLKELRTVEKGSASLNEFDPRKQNEIEKLIEKTAEKSDLIDLGNPLN